MSKKLLSKLFVLLLVVGLLFAAAPTGQAQAATTVSTETQLRDALLDTGVTEIELGADIALANELVITRAVTIDLNGKTLSKPTTTSVDRVFHVQTGGNLTVNATGGGSVSSPDTADGRAFEMLADASATMTINGGAFTAGFRNIVNQTNMLIVNNGTINGKDMGISVRGNRTTTDVKTTTLTVNNGTISSGDYPAVHVAGYGATFNLVGGTLTGVGGRVGAPVLMGNGSSPDWGTVINISGGEIYAQGGTGISQPQKGVLNISGGLITANTGIEIKSGTLNMTGGTIVANGAKVDPPAHGEDGTALSGDGIFVVTRTGYDWPINVNLTGGSISSTNAWAVREFLHATATESKSVTIINGTTLSGGALLLKPVVNATQMIGYTTIQAAIDAANAGDTINVAAGSYPEDVLIDRSLTILGPNSDISPVTETRLPEAVVTSFRTQYSEALAGVTIKGFEVTGQVLSTGTLAGIYVGNTQNVTIEHNYIHGVEAHGIAHFDTPISDLNILDNKLINVGTGTNSGVYIGFLTNAVISGNLIDTTAYGGILLTASSTGVDVIGNTISNTAGVGIQVSSGLADIDVSGNIISNAGNGLNEADKGGIRIYGSGLTGLVSVYDNTISGSQNGIGIKDSTSCDLSHLNIYHNSIATTNEVQVYNGCTDTSILDVTVNWWESITGPTVGKVVGTADYTPWCANAECTEFLPAQVTIAQPTSVVCGNTTETTIVINVAGIPTSAPLQAYSFYLEFDETKVSIGDLLSFENGEFLDGGAFQLHPVDGDLGKVQIAYTAYGVSDSVGGGKLATIPLNLLGVAGDVSLVLSGVELSQFDQQYLIPAEVSTTPVILTLDPAVINTTQSDAGYCSLAQAVDAAVAGDNLKLVANIAIPETVTIETELTLDLNGKTATVPTGGYGLDVTSTAGNLTITDSSAGASGAITGGYNTVWVGGGATFTLDKGSLTGALYGVGVVGEGSTVIVDGGVIDSVYFAITGNGSAGNGGTIIDINGGTLSSDYTAIYVPQAGSVDISAGTISGHTGIEVRSGSLTISGGSITATGQYLPVPGTYSNGSLESGDAIFINTNPDYAGNMIINISGGTFTSATGYAMREYVYDSAGVTEVETLTVTGGTFIGGVDSGEAGAAVTFSDLLVAANTAGTSDLDLLPGGLYNTDPASPTVFVFVPYGTVLNGTMYEIVGISLNVTDFYYNNNGILRGVSTDFTVTNFVFAEATSVTVELFSGAGTTESPWALQQTNTLKTPASWNQSTLSSSFDIFGTYVSGSWNNTRATEYGQHVPPTRVLVTVVLPGGTLTGENLIPDFEYSLIQPSLVAEDFAYMASSGVRGVTAGFHPVNFTLDQVLTLKVELFAGTQLLQTNISPVPSVHGVALLQQFSGPFDIFGTFDYLHDYAPGTTTPYWNNTRASEYGQTLVPTRVLATVTLPGGVTRTAENLLLTGTRTDILPMVNGFVYMQGRFAGTGPRFGVPLMLKGAAGDEHPATSSDLTNINYGFAGLELQEYTITTNQPRYLNIYFDDVADDNGVFSRKFTITGDRTLPDLRLRAGNAVWTDNVINTVDAGQVGTDWNGTFDVAYTGPCGDVNFDGKVNIQDLALVGGNYELTSADAYGTWLQ